MHRAKRKQPLWIREFVSRCSFCFVSKGSERNLVKEKLVYQTTWKFSEAFSMHTQHYAFFPLCSPERWRQTSRLWVSYSLHNVMTFPKTLFCLDPWDRVLWRSGNELDLQSASSRFESLPGTGYFHRRS